MIRGSALLLALILAGLLVVSGQARANPASRPPGLTAAGVNPFELARRYEAGESVPQNYHRAHLLYCQAARHGDNRAFLSLAWMYLNGRGVAQSDRAAAFWLRKAAAHGVPQAANLLRLISPVAPANPGCPSHLMRDAGGGFAPVTISLAAAPHSIRRAAEETARHVGVNGNLLLSMIAVESAFDPLAVSPKNAMGLMQLLPTTAERFRVRDPFDYRQNLRGGATYIRWLLDRFQGNLRLALAAYNAGEGAVASHGGVPPFAETRAYVERVTRLCRCGQRGARGQPDNRGAAARSQ